MPWKRLQRQPSSLLLLAPLASLLWVTGHLWHSQQPRFSGYGKNKNGFRTFGEDSIPPRFQEFSDLVKSMKQNDATYNASNLTGITYSPIALRIASWGQFLSAFFPSAGSLPVNPCTYAEEQDWGKCVWEQVKPFVQLGKSIFFESVAKGFFQKTCSRHPHVSKSLGYWLIHAWWRGQLGGSLDQATLRWATVGSGLWRFVDGFSDWCPNIGL